jgi:two-component system, sensor histidine kinase
MAWQIQKQHPKVQFCVTRGIYYGRPIRSRGRDLQIGAQAIVQNRAVCNAHIPALLFTGDTAKDRLIEATHSGIPLLSKPVAPAVLYEKVKALMS